MPIVFTQNKPSQENSDIIGELVSGTGKVPDYIDFGAVAIRSDDPSVIEEIQALLGGDIETNEGKRSHYVVFDEGTSLAIQGEYLRTSMLLRSRNDGSTLRQCDGETMSNAGNEGKDCICLRDYEYGTPEWRAAAKENMACKPNGLLFFTIPGLSTPGKFVFSKSSESTVRAFTDLESQLPEDYTDTFEVEVGIRTINSKKTGYSWSVPTFTHPVLPEPAGD